MTARTGATPGLFVDMPGHAYAKLNAISKTRLSDFAVSPLHARWFMDNPRPTSSAKDLGIAVHTALLEPDEFVKTYRILPEEAGRDRRLKAYKQAATEAEAEGLIPLTCEVGEHLAGITHRAETHEKAGELLASAEYKELSAVAPHARKEDGSPGTGLMLKVRADALWTKAGMGIEVKTVSSFSRLGRLDLYAWSQRWPHQAAMTTDVINDAAIGCGNRDSPNGPDIHISHFIFIVCETSPPYAVGCYDMDMGAMELARSRLDGELEYYAQCQAMNVWPGPEDHMGTIHAPHWEMERG